MATKIKGKVVTTSKKNEEILSDGNVATVEAIRNVSIENMGNSDANVIFNGGDKILIESGETLTLGDILIESIVVVESGSKIRYIGI